MQQTLSQGLALSQGTVGGNELVAADTHHREQQLPQTKGQQIVTNLLAGLTTSFAAIALGAAFGVASGRGALVGILSAGCIALVAATLGGTRVQCSGPTAPMTTVTTVFVAYSRQELLQPGTISAEGWGELKHHPDNCTDSSGAYTPVSCPLPDYFCNVCFPNCPKQFAFWSLSDTTVVPADRDAHGRVLHRTHGRLPCGSADLVCAKRCHQRFHERDCCADLAEADLSADRREGDEGIGAAELAGDLGHHGSVLPAASDHAAADASEDCKVHAVHLDRHRADDLRLYTTGRLYSARRGRLLR